MNEADRPIDARQLAERFRIPLRQARAWLREMPHHQRGRRRWTTEAWLAGYLAAHCVRPVPMNHLDVLEEQFHHRIVNTIERLVREGRLHVSQISHSAA